MLWVKGPLGRLARLSLASFLSQGFKVALWTYDKAALGDTGAELRDAAEIAPLSADMAALSSLIRYRLLATEGGLWSDMDVVAFAGPQALPAGAFVASEKRRPFRHAEPTATGEGLTQVTNCFMGNARPAAGDLWHRAAATIEALAPEDRDWESVGPHLLSRLMIARPDHGVAILPPEAVDPVAWWNVPAYFLEARDPPEAPFMHMYASIWSKRDVDPEAEFPRTSLAAKLCAMFGV
jgi:hypothetical protein